LRNLALRAGRVRHGELGDSGIDAIQGVWRRR